MYLSSGARALTGQPPFRVLARAKALERQGRSILHFEIGEPDFDTPDNIKEAAIQALRAGETNYVNSGGIIEMKTAVQEEIERTRGFKPDIEQILIGTGANPMIYYAMACVAEKGDEILMQDPAFPTYHSALAALGLKPVYVPLREEHNFRLQADDVAEAITPRTRMILVNSPQNPTGAVMRREELRAMGEIAEDKGIYLFSDEVYSKLIYEGEHYSPGVMDACQERTVVVDGFSKSYAMTGWRLGYCVGPKPLIEKMELLAQTIVSCVPPFVQYGGIEALRGPQDFVAEMRDEYRKRREVIVNGLNEIPGFRCVKPQGAFYAFPSIKDTGMSSDEMADFLLDKVGVAVLPGNGFGPSGEGYLRFSYATAMDHIKAALQRIKAAMEGVM